MSLEHARELAELRAETGEVGAREFRERMEVGIGEEMHAARAVVVGQVGGDALAARAERHGHLPLRPGERLDAPFLAHAAVVLEGLGRALEHHHVAERELERAREPAVQLHQETARHVALRELELAAHHVAAEHRTRHHLAALGGRDAGEIPELSLQKRQRGHRVVTRRHRHHVSARAMAQVALAREQHGGVRVKVRPHALLEHERVLAQVVGGEGPPPPHRARRDRGGATLPLGAETHEELLDGRLHPSSSSS